MDLLDLLVRPPLFPGPLTLVVRPVGGHCDARDAVSRALCLLSGRKERDEILVLVRDHSHPDVPARIDGVRVRVQSCGIEDPPSLLRRAIEASTRPAMLLVDDRLAVSREEFTAIIDRLNLADVVVGHRRRRGGWLVWPIERLIRAVFGVPLADPFSPVKAIRRAAVEGLVLETADDTADFELLAKLTYLVSLVDEMPIADAWTGPGIAAVIASRLPRTLGVWLWPRLWRTDHSGVPANRNLHRESTREDAITPISKSLPFASSRRPARSSIGGCRVGFPGRATNRFPTK